ncbi:TonB-dependent receptor [bacterium]|nr:MAG: TonB-dependent receptor [bacterium]
MTKTLYIVLASTFVSAMALAQHAKLSGTVIDLMSRTPLVSSNVSLVSASDTSNKRYTSTNREGKFFFTDVAEGAYNLRISYVGSGELFRKVTVTGTGVDLGILMLSQRSILMSEVVVTGDAPPVVQFGDTVQFNSKAFKLNVDASAEDLVSKLPGVTIENNTVKAQGEDVAQILVDGKRFFGDDPMIALRNLPADVIERIQVYDKLSDQAELTGFNDGQTSRTINIITRPDRRRGQFGRIIAAYGDDGKYQAVGNVNMFQGSRRLTILAQSNDINQQNFSTQDFLGAMSGTAGGGGMPGMRGGGGGGGGGGQRGGGGGDGRGISATGPAVQAMQNNFSIGQQNGINTTHALGLQYTDSWAAGLNAEGNYFFNLTDNNRVQLTNRQYFLSPDTSQYYRQSNLTDGKNYNHRLNMRIEYAIDSVNSIIFTPRVSLQSNASTSNSNGLNWLLQNVPISRSGTENRTDVDGYTSSNSIVFRHKFDARGRTMSIQASANLNDRKNARYLESDNEYYYGAKVQVDSVDQLANTKTKGYSFSANIAYTEPVGVSGLAQLNYTISKSNNSTDKKSYNYNFLEGQYDLPVASLSNEVVSGYLTQRGGIGYQYRTTDFDVNAGVGFQRASLSADRTFPKSVTTDKVFSNILPTLTLFFGPSRRNSIQVLYRTATSPPSISQLENTVNNSNPFFLSAGNPDLEQYYTHTLTTRYVTTDLQTMESFFALVSGSITADYIGNALLLAPRDSVLEGGVLLKQGSQFSRPENLGTQRSLRGLLTYSFPFKLIQSIININTGLSYNGTPSILNNSGNTGHTYTLTQGLSISSNISTDLDFAISYNANFNTLKNSMQPDLDNQYFSHNAHFRLNWTFWEGFTFRTDVRNQLYTRAQTGFKQSYTLWNMTFGKKFLADNKGELSVQMFDLLNQNKNVSQTVTDTYIEEQQTNNITRYFLVTFSYRLNNF